MNERETRQDIVNIHKILNSACDEKIKCKDCPYQNVPNHNCMAYAVEDALVHSGYENNRATARPIHEIIINVWSTTKCFGVCCESCKWKRYGSDCLEQHWARDIYENGWRKKNDTEKRHSAN